MNNDGIWVVVPAYNEAGAIRATISDLRRRFNNVVVIDDASSDETSAIATKSGAWVLRHPLNLGQGAALQTGLDFATRQPDSKKIVTFDADGQHKADDAWRLCETLTSKNVEVVLGSRFAGNTVGMPTQRAILLRLAIWFTRLTTGLKLTDTHNGLKAFDVEAAKKLQLSQNRMAHASEILAQISDLKLRYCEEPITIEYSAYSLEKGQKNSNSLRVLAELLVGWLAK